MSITPQTERLEHVARWRASGLSMAAYCRQELVPYHRFTYWVQQEGARRAQSAALAPVASAKVPDHFTCVELSPNPTNDCLSVPVLSLELPSGIRLELGRSCSRHEILAVVQAVLS